MSTFVAEMRTVADKTIEAKYFEIANDFIKFYDENDSVVVAIPNSLVFMVYKQESLK